MANERFPQDGLEKLQSNLERLSDRQKDEMYELLKKDKERSSWPTATLCSTFWNYFAIIKANHPWITDEEAMSIYEGYLVPKTIQVKYGAWNTREETYSFLDDHKFAEEEIFPWMHQGWREECRKFLYSQPTATNQRISSEELEEVKKYLDSNGKSAKR